MVSVSTQKLNVFHDVYTTYKILSKINYVCVIHVFISLITSCFCDDEGVSCFTKDQQSGVCKPIQFCPTAIDNLRLKIQPTHCDFGVRHPIVCCSKVGEISKKKCAWYKMSKALPIVGGDDAKVNEFPHMVALGFGELSDIKWQCGGTLISTNHILTAAHCLQSRLGKVSYAKLGNVNMDDTKGIQVKIVKRIPYPLYSPPSLYHDIAILEFEGDVLDVTLGIWPTCLYTEDKMDESTSGSLLALGWGLLEFGGSPSNILQKVHLELFTKKECTETFKTTRRYTKGILFDRQICAGSKNHPRDTCQGDSGGPLQFINDYMFHIAGITSFGKSCGTVNLPSIYTKVSYYVPWIEKTIWFNDTNIF